jgi:hypothetical protein
MKRGKLVIPLLIMLLLILQGCDKLIDNWEENSDRNTIYGSGRLVELEYEFNDFDKVLLTHVYNANVKKGEEYSIILRVDDNIEEFVSVYQLADKLHFSLDSENNYSEVTLEVDITMPDIEMLELSGATHAKLQGFSFDHSLSIDLSGASSVNGSIDVSELQAQLSGASSIYLTGSGEIVDLSVSGASFVDLANFSGINGYVSMSGASNGKVNLEETLQVQLSGTSQLWYAGNPQVYIIEISGLAKLHRLY